jgi:hypothetical protein
MFQFKLLETDPRLHPAELRRLLQSQLPYLVLLSQYLPHQQMVWALLARAKAYPRLQLHY